MVCGVGCGRAPGTVHPISLIEILTDLKMTPKNTRFGDRARVPGSEDLRVDFRDYSPGQFFEIGLLGIGECPISVASGQESLWTSPYTK